MTSTIQRQGQSDQQPGAGHAAQRGASAQPTFGAGKQPLTKKHSEAALGLSGKERSAFLEALPPMTQDDTFDTSAMPTHSGMSSGRTGIHRPQARWTGSGSSDSKLQASTYDQQALAAALSWQHGSLSNKNAEGSATSDEDHPRLVPRRGAGPELRSSGREIDEYLMRLLNAGSVDPSQDVVFHNLTPPVNGDAAANVGTSVAFPAGWNTAKPWFAQHNATTGSKGPQAVSPPQAPNVKPVMPPPSFPAQPWQGSRLGPLPPLGPLAQRPKNVREAGKMMGASSEGTIVTAVLPARCPEGPGQGSLKRGLPKVSLLLMDMPQQHQHQQQTMHQRSAENADKRQKTEGSRPEALPVKTVVSGQQHTPKDARLPRTPPCIKIEPLSQQRQETQPIQADERIAQVVTGRVGKLGMNVIRDTMMRQQALFTEQVEDLHRIVTRQNVLIGRFGIPKEEVPQVQQAQPIKKDNRSSDAAADPRTVLLSHLGNGSGGSHPSTEQGSWPQMQSDTGRDASLPSGRIQPVQQTRNAQQAQSVRHPVNQAPAVRTGHPASVSATVLTAQQAHQIQQTQQVQGAQQAQHAMQQEKAAAQELLAFSRQGPKEAASKAGLYMQTGQTTGQETVGLSPRFRAGSCQPEATPDIPTDLDPRLMTGQFGRSGSGQLKHANSGQAGQDNLMRAASDQLMQNIRAMSGQLSGQAEAAMPAQHNLGQAGSCNVAFMDPQASRLQMQENVEAQLRQGARSHPPHQAVHPAGPNVNIAVQQQQQLNAAAWYAEFMHHMSIQQPAKLMPCPATWPWNLHYNHSQLAAQAVNAAALGLRPTPGNGEAMWQGQGAPGSAFGLQQAMAAQAAAQQEQQQQASGMQAQCDISNTMLPDGASEDAASQESARESHQDNAEAHTDTVDADAPLAKAAGASEQAPAAVRTGKPDEATSSLILW